MPAAKYLSALSVLTLFTIKFAFSQVEITGPSCITSNTVYLYTINGDFDSVHTWNICISGGIIDSTDSFTCLNNKWDGFIKIRWNTTDSGLVQLTSDAGSASLAVSYTSALQGGLIDSIVLIQAVDSFTLPADVTCSSAYGGSCNPVYDYQWQQSPDNLQWADIPDATNQNLQFTATPQQSGYYRRTVKAEGSDAIAYSKAAAVFIKQ